MDGDLVLIFGFILSVVAVAAIAINRIVAKVYDHKRWETEHRTSHGSGNRTVVSDEKYTLLEDRVRVLERIATDSGSVLAAQIEDLRLSREDVQ